MVFAGMRITNTATSHSKPRILHYLAGNGLGWESGKERCSYQNIMIMDAFCSNRSDPGHATPLLKMALRSRLSIDNYALVASALIVLILVTKWFRFRRALLRSALLQVYIKDLSLWVLTFLNVTLWWVKSAHDHGLWLVVSKSFARRADCVALRAHPCKPLHSADSVTNEIRLTSTSSNFAGTLNSFMVTG